jgi:hypothetical protein
MYIFVPEKSGKQPYAQCGNYRRAHDRIEHHYIPDYLTSRRIIVNNILELVRNTIKGIADYARIDKTALEKAVREMLATQQTDEVKAQQKRLAACRTRYAELERLLNKIYEDNALGRLPEKRYESLLETYGKEQETLEAEIAKIQSAVEKFENENTRVERFMKLVERYTDFEEITTVMIHEFVEKIVVHEREKPMVQTSPQKIEIHLNFIGEFSLPNAEREPTPEDLAEQERLEKERERNRERYLKRKASGYYETLKKAKSECPALPMSANQ